MQDQWLWAAKSGLFHFIIFILTRLGFNLEGLTLSQLHAQSIVCFHRQTVFKVFNIYLLCGMCMCAPMLMLVIMACILRASRRQLEGIVSLLPGCRACTKWVCPLIRFYSQSNREEGMAFTHTPCLAETQSSPHVCFSGAGLTVDEPVLRCHIIQSPALPAFALGSLLHV